MPHPPQEMYQRAQWFLQSMGYQVRREVRNVPITLSYQEAKRYSEIFNQFDKDKDGHINVHDLRKALHEMGEKVSDDELRELIAEVDINKNCTIEEEEFLQVCTIKIIVKSFILVGHTILHNPC